MPRDVAVEIPAAVYLSSRHGFNSSGIEIRCDNFSDWFGIYRAKTVLRNEGPLKPSDRSKHKRYIQATVGIDGRSDAAAMELDCPFGDG